MAQSLFAGKRLASYVNLVGAVLIVISAIVYAVETTAASNFNAAVVVALVIAAACAVLFALVPHKVCDLGNLVAVGLIAYALATFLINSINTLVDALTGLTMFGSDGNADYVITVCALMGVCLVVEIVSCFMSRDPKER